ncbi:hypothetical protein EV148_1097 [Dokdonella fugitiva]|uniref:Uncharacterized protein n=1 Tax=Dokdonella fugitiva TaxID=328517 RepID=A0A4R2I575_9GAMM|nr:hypothetical protein [Dokdonella fugitiva]TCO37655.1 hypothetical protein EV148_1097 [Dokdonella fugitiva]
MCRTLDAVVGVWTRPRHAAKANNPLPDPPARIMAL